MPLSGLIPILNLMKFLEFISLITDSTPLWPAAPRFLTILISPRGMSMSSWMTTRSSGFNLCFLSNSLTLFPDSFIKVLGSARMTFFKYRASKRSEGGDERSSSTTLAPTLCRVFSYFLPGFPSPIIMIINLF